MPSSPPPFFGLYEDENEGDSAAGGAVWSEFLPDGVGEGYDGLDGILGTLDTNTLDGTMGKNGAVGGGVQPAGSGMVDFSGFFGGGVGGDVEGSRSASVEI